MVELYFSTTRYHVKLLNIKLGTSCALNNLVFVTDQATLIVMSSSDHSSSKIRSTFSLFSAKAVQQSS